MIRSFYFKKIACFLTAFVSIVPAYATELPLQSRSEEFIMVHTAVGRSLCQIQAICKQLGKYGKNIEHKDTITKAHDALVNFIEVKTKPLNHYFKQAITTTLPDNAYAEIYSVFNIVLLSTLLLVEELNKHIVSNFSTELWYDFLLNAREATSYENITAHTVLESSARLDTAFHNLQHSIQSIGLTRWNKLARTVHNYIMEPCANALQIKDFPSWWNNALGMSDSEKFDWLLQFCEQTPLQKPWTINPSCEVTFKDIIGHDHIKARVEQLIKYAKDPSIYAQNNREISTNYSFLGLKGIGKTYFARALMGEIRAANKNFSTFRIPCSVLNELGPEELIKRIQMHAPCVVLIDNFDEYLDLIEKIPFNSIETALKIFSNISPSSDRPVILLHTTEKLREINTHFANIVEQMTLAGKLNTATILFIPTPQTKVIPLILQSCGENPGNFDIERLAEKAKLLNIPSVKIKKLILNLQKSAKERNIELTTDLLINVIDKMFCI